MEQKILQLRSLSSFAKVFPDRIVGRVSHATEAARGQEVSFQIAYRKRNEIKYCQTYYDIEVSSPLKDALRVFTVGTVPANLAAYPERTDDNYISLKPGVFPDPLYPLETNKVKAALLFWRTLWFSVRIPEDCPAGTYPVTVSFRKSDDPDAEVDQVVYKITVHPYSLPKQKLLYTQWFHCDCIADAHGVEVLSEAHWALIENYMRLAAEHGQNMILTPVLTPPLDTAIGSERPTVQLVEITKNGDRYSFDYSKLERFLKMALSFGIETFEISHLFTQWGALHAPKVMAHVDGEVRRIFGWETDACSEEYRNFLGQFVPALIDFCLSMGLSREQLYFHVSDEPKRAQIDSYRAAEEILAPLLDGCKHMDALSDFDFYQEKLVEVPVVSTNHLEPYLEANVQGLWCYYCCSQCREVSNRFLAMPSARNRIIGVQMYKYNMAGFLHWGYNFYYSQLSVRKVNPFAETDSDAGFPGGDAFSVYPYGDGAIPSLRQKVFGNALEDMRLLSLLEEKIGRERVIEAIDRIAGQTVTFNQYPRDEKFFAELYRYIFAELAKD